MHLSAIVEAARRRRRRRLRSADRRDTDLPLVVRFHGPDAGRRRRGSRSLHALRRGRDRGLSHDPRRLTRRAPPLASAGLDLAGRLAASLETRSDAGRRSRETGGHHGLLDQGPPLRPPHPDPPPGRHRGRDPVDRPRRGRQRRRVQPGQRPPAAAAARRSKRPTNWCASTSSARASTGRWASRSPISAICAMRPASWSRRSAGTPTTSSVSRSTARRRCRWRASVVVGDYFATLGVQPALGRLFGSAEDDARDAVIVVAHDFWLDRLAGDPGAIGRAVVLDGQTFTDRRRRPARLRRHRDAVRSRPLGAGAGGRSPARRSSRSAARRRCESPRACARASRARSSRSGWRRCRPRWPPSIRRRTKATCSTPCPTPTRASKPGWAGR